VKGEVGMDFNCIKCGKRLKIINFDYEKSEKMLKLKLGCFSCWSLFQFFFQLVTFEEIE